ncbi:MAG: beta-hydroxyacyl-ACP dehydratase [Planctomycetota bacterium]|nr:beta-hydroxyacyl-ACP dehydratase [Planctomycetota bacterium]
MRWMWIDQIIQYEPDRRLVAIKNVSLAEEHLHDHFESGPDGDALPLMPTSLIIEGMAQTAGILVGTMSRFQEKVVLAKVVKATMEKDVVPGQTLRYEAEIERYDPLGASTQGKIFRLTHPETEWEQIGTIDLMFSHLDQNVSGIEFPEENFVFSDNFKTILQSAGLAHLAAIESE